MIIRNSNLPLRIVHQLFTSLLIILKLVFPTSASSAFKAQGSCFLCGDGFWDPSYLGSQFYKVFVFQGPGLGSWSLFWFMSAGTRHAKWYQSHSKKKIDTVKYFESMINSKVIIVKAANLVIYYWYLVYNCYWSVTVSDLLDHSP